MPNPTQRNFLNINDKTKIRILSALKIFAGLLIIALMALITKAVFDGKGWALALSIGNIFFLIIVRVQNYESLIGIDELEKFWKKNKNRKNTILIHCASCTEQAKNQNIIVTTPLHLVNAAEDHVKIIFLLKDSKSHLISFRSEIATIVGLNILVLIIFLCSGNDSQLFMSTNSKWDKNIVELVNTYKQQAEIALALAAILIQAAFLLKIPFLLDIRNKTYLAERKSR